MEPSQNGRRKTVFSLDLTKILLESIYAFVTESESVTSKNISGSEKRAWVEGINVTVLMSITRPANFCPGKARKAYFLSADRTLSTVRTRKANVFPGRPSRYPKFTPSFRESKFLSADRTLSAFRDGKQFSFPDFPC